MKKSEVFKMEWFKNLEDLRVLIISSELKKSNDKFQYLISKNGNFKKYKIEFKDLNGFFKSEFYEVDKIEEVKKVVQGKIYFFEFID